jgi:hypothetical protein
MACGKGEDSQPIKGSLAMPTSSIKGPHLVRYGTASDQCYLLNDFAKTYDQLVINANILAHMPSAMGNFVVHKAKKPYFIDPQTHAFQHSVEHLLSTSKKSAGEIKKSWRSLLNSYGEPLATIIGKEQRPLLPSDLDKTSVRKAFCKRVLAFQNDTITHSIKDGKDAKYFQYLAKKKNVQLADHPPTLLVAPYFFMSAQFAAEWRKTNIECLEDSRAIINDTKYDLPLAAQIVISKDILATDSYRDDLVKAYTSSSAKPDVFLIWIDDFKEENQSEVYLNNYQDLISQLAQTGSEVIVLYGGFFSIAAALAGGLKGKLSGVCHGLEYGESKSVVPVAGGIPVAKYYLPRLHSRLSASVAVKSIQVLDGFKSAPIFHKEICNCNICKSVIVKVPTSEFAKFTATKDSTFWRAGRRVSMDFPTAETSDLCAKHYMWCKYAEYQDKRTKGDICKELKATYGALKKVIGLDHVGHADVWADALSKV